MRRKRREEIAFLLRGMAQEASLEQPEKNVNLNFTNLTWMSK
jgi:hypothetical protein